MIGMTVRTNGNQVCIDMKYDNKPLMACSNSFGQSLNWILELMVNEVFGEANHD